MAKKTDSLIASGECGTCVWSIDEHGHLLIAPKDGDEGVLGEYHPWKDPELRVCTVSFSGSIKVRSCFHMFKDCPSLTSVDLSGLDTSQVETMSEMFDGCSSLTSINLSGTDSSNVRTMEHMFHGCSSLTSLDLSLLDTSRVELMYSMFSGCSSLVSLDLSGFETSNVESMSCMFEGCSSLSSLDLASFDTSKVRSMVAMFRGCCRLTSLDISMLDTSRVNLMYAMFSDCSSLASLNLPKFSASKGKTTDPSLAGTFNGCSSLKSLDLSGFNTSGIYDMESMFEGCSSLTSLDLSSFETSRLAKMRAMFNGCQSLTTIYVGEGWCQDDLNLRGKCFDGCKSLAGGNGTAYDRKHANAEYARIDADGIPGYFTAVEGVMSLDEILAKRESLVEAGRCGKCIWTIDEDGHLLIESKEGFVGELEEWEQSPPWAKCFERVRSVSFKGTVKAVTCDRMFAIERARGVWRNSDPNEVSSVDLTGLDTSQVKSMSGMFYDCSSLASVDLAPLDTSKTEKMSSMFEGCSSLESADLSPLDTSSTEWMDHMFSGCSSLTSLDLSGFDTSRTQSMEAMFFGCEALREIRVGDAWNLGKLGNSMEMFTGCESLVGSNGTAYKPEWVVASRACIDADGAPGYFTAKE